MIRETLKFRATLPLTACLIALGTIATAATDMDRDARFERLDQNGDGKIERSEMNMARDTRFSETDADGDGFLTLEEIQAQAEERIKPRSEAMLQRRDVDGDGKLSLEEVQSNPRAQRRFDRIDTNSDGAIDKSEFDAAAAQARKRRASLE